MPRCSISGAAMAGYVIIEGNILTNWGRLIELDQANTREPDRGELAMAAVRAGGYRDVELIRYDGLKASNPM